jgi:hypothetical protein
LEVGGCSSIRTIMPGGVELPRKYAEYDSQEAFAELVRSRVGPVCSIELRRVGGGGQLAEGVAQVAFRDLADVAAQFPTGFRTRI